MKYRKLEEKLFKFCAYFSASIVVIALLIILGSIAYQGIPAINLEFLLSQEAMRFGPNGKPLLGGAIGNAIAGTFLLVVFSIMLSTPVGIGTAIYLQRYTKSDRFAEYMAFVIEVLSGIPSIVLGVMGFLIFVVIMKSITGGFSLISASLALAILVLPTIERSAEVAIKTVPRELEEASYALGATKTHTLRLITLPYASTGIITGIILGVGRAAEESAVVALTAGYTQFLPEFKVEHQSGFLFGLKIYPFQDLVASLPIAVYHSYEMPQFFPMSQGFAAAFVLILIVMLVNCSTKLIVWRLKSQ